MYAEHSFSFSSELPTLSLARGGTKGSHTYIDYYLAWCCVADDDEIGQRRVLFLIHVRNGQRRRREPHH
jgi:hypothetical protein